LLNLLNNAHDAVEKVPDRWIRISAADLGKDVEIRVADSGPGISPGLRERIFQPFFTTKDVGKGTGLGLSVAKGIIESHAGWLGLNPSPEETCFVIQLPKSQTGASV
jgi:signal transduction histidine kinase